VEETEEVTMRHLVLALLCVVALTANAWAAGDSVGVIERVHALRDAVNKHDAAAAAGLWTLDGSYLDDEGNRFSGRDALQKMFADVFASNPTRAVVELDVEKMRLINKDVATVDGAVKVAGRVANRFSLTLVRTGADWMISSGTETPVAVRSTSTSSNPLAALGWLIGNWHAERNGGAVNMKAEWIANNNFILCKYEVKKGAQPAQIEAQIIGWDPRSGRPISWQYDANGGFGEGLWIKDGDKWAVDMINTGTDGARLTATNVISELNKDSFTWQSVNRRRNGAWIEDTAPIKVDRAAK
jgi:uncharacterized protein (TIGR02246 family)